MRFLIIPLLLFGGLAWASGINDRMSLLEAIDYLGQHGIEITYSSRLVEPWMRVRTTPSTSHPVAALAEALAVYGLDLVHGPHGQWLVVEGDAPAPALDSGLGSQLPAVKEDQLPRLEIDEVKIVASRYELFDRHAGSEQFLSGEDIRLLPHIADDVFRAFHRLPGAAATDFSAPFHLRGGALDEVKVVLDGLELFEPYHMRTVFNPLSIIDPGIIENVSVLSGGFTADYGNHMSGVVDISSSWSSTAPVFETGVSFVNAFFRGAGTWGDKGAYQFSARRGYLDLVADAAEVGNEEFTPRYSDVFMKAGYALSDSTSIDAHVLFAADDVEYGNTDEGEEGQSKSSLNYAWLTIDTEPSEHLRWINILSTGRTSNRDEGSSNNLPSEDVHRFFDREVEVSGVQSDLSLRVSDSQLWMLGLRYRHLVADFEYEIDSVRQSDFFNGGLPLEVYRNILASSSGDEFGAYLRYRFRPTLRSTWEVGLRWDKQTYTGTGNDSQLSPRANVLFQLDDQTNLRLGWGDYYQPQGIQELQVEDGVTGYFPAAKARHLVAGIRRRFDSDLDLQVEIYQKRYSDLRPRFENALDVFDYAAESDFDRIRVDPGSAESQGVEITLRDRQSDHFDWWLNYTWSKAVDVIEGVEVRRSWDQRHALTGNLSWRGEKWTLSLVARYHSGWPLTPLLVTPILDASGAMVAIDGDLSQRNQTNYDDYFRVDVRLSRTVDLDRGSFNYYFEIFNLFNTENQCCVAGHNLTVQPTVSVSPNFDAYMPFFPSFGVVWTFGPGAG
jgi:outer membrane cobalamin receptor